MITEPKLENRIDQHYIAIRTQVTMQELGTGVIPQLHREVRAWLENQGLAPTGAPFIRYRVINMMEKLDIEMGWPVANALSGNDRICADVLPAGRYASLVYIGPYEGDGLIKANAALLDWGSQQGITWDRWQDEHGDGFGGRLESYLKDPGNEPDSTKWETEVAIRLADDRPQ